MRRSLVFWLSLLGLGGAGVWLLVVSTPLGVGLSWDSFTYISSAHGWLNGLGLARLTSCGELKPMTGYPPLYPWVLASFEWAGLSAVRAARVISALAYGATVILTGLIVRRLTLSYLAALFAALLVLTSSTILGTYSWAWTEPAFVVVSLMCLLSLGEYVGSGRGWALALTAVCLSLAMLLRYAGLALFGAVTLVLMLHHLMARPRALNSRWLASAAALGLAAAPLAGWMGRNLLLRGNPVNRHLEWHPLGPENIAQLGRTVTAWLLPASVNPLGQPMTRQALPTPFAEWIPVLVGLTLLLAAVWAVRACRTARRLDPCTVLLIWIMGYLGFLVVSLILFDPRIPLDDRILAPAHVPALALAVMGLACLWRMARPVWRAWVMAAALGLAGVHGVQIASTVAVLQDDGQGYAATRWRSSPLMELLRGQKPSRIYTNEIPAVYFNASVVACSIPVQDDQAALDAMRDDLQAEGTVLVLFGRVSPEYAPEEAMTEGMRAAVDIAWDGRLFNPGGD